MTAVSRPRPCSSASWSARRTSSSPSASPSWQRARPRQWSANAGSGRPSSAASASARSAAATASRVLAGERVAPGRVGVGGDELRPGRLRLEQLDRLGEHLLASWVAEPVDDEPEAGQDAAGGHGLALLAVEVERPARTPASPPAAGPAAGRPAPSAPAATRARDRLAGASSSARAQLLARPGRRRVRAPAHRPARGSAPPAPAAPPPARR